MRKRLTADIITSARVRKADPYTMNQERKNPDVTKYMNWERTPGHDLPFGGPADTHELHENDKKSRDPATHLIVPEGGIKASKEIDTYLKTKAARAIKLAKAFFPGKKVKASVIEKIATKFMNLSDDALVATINLVSQDVGPVAEHDKPVLIEDWQEDDGKKVGTKAECKKEEKKEASTKKAEVLVEDLTSKEGVDFKEEEDYGQTEEFPVNDGTTASVDAIDSLLADLDPTVAHMSEQEVSFHGASMDISEGILSSLFTSKECEEEEEKNKKAAVASAPAKKGIKKVASAPAATSMSSADLGMSLFGSGLPSDPTGGLF